MKRLLVIVILAALAIPSLSRVLPHEEARGASEFGAVEGSSAWSIESGGRDRSFRMYVPADLSLNVPATLVVMLHGRYGSGRQAEVYYGWDAVADAGGFIVAYPDGSDRAWNAGGGCCREPGQTDLDDVGFVLDMIDLISSRVAIDPDRIFAAGMSNGGKMAYRLACESDRFAAIAAVAATLLVPCESAAPVSVLAIHGTDDPFAHYDGGPVSGVPGLLGPAIPDVIAFWREVNDCGMPVEAILGNVSDFYSNCAGGRAVELLTITHMSHVWPGGGRGPIDQMLSAIRGGDEFVATIAIWEFFDSHPRN